MNLQELLEEVCNLKLEEKRAQSPQYLEVVVSRAALNSLGKILAAYFGPPLKPEGHPPSWEASLLSKPYGGIRGEQTMYALKGESYNEYAFLWPWGGGGERITVKILRARTTSRGPGVVAFLKSLFGRK